MNEKEKLIFMRIYVAVLFNFFLKCRFGRRSRKEVVRERERVRKQQRLRNEKQQQQKKEKKKKERARKKK